MKAFSSALVVAILFAASASVAETERAQIWAGKGAITEGIVTLGAPPETVYAVATDYRRWTSLLSDITWVSVKSGGPDDASLRFSSRGLGETVTVKFENLRGRAIRFRLTDGPPGARAWGQYLLQPTADGRGTVMRATLYLDEVGVLGWFVRDKSLKGKRERKLRADLDDLARRFPVR